jgi:hypothetical protein
LVIDKYIDLSEGLKISDDQLVIIIIERADGDFEQYIMPSYLSDVDQALELKAEDKIIYSNPLIIYHSTPNPFITANTIYQTPVPSSTQNNGTLGTSATAITYPPPDDFDYTLPTFKSKSSSPYP